MQVLPARVPTRDVLLKKNLGQPNISYAEDTNSVPDFLSLDQTRFSQPSASFSKHAISHEALRTPSKQLNDLKALASNFLEALKDWESSATEIGNLKKIANTTNNKQSHSQKEQSTKINEIDQNVVSLKFSEGKETDEDTFETETIGTNMKLQQIHDVEHVATKSD